MIRISPGLILVMSYLVLTYGIAWTFNVIFDLESISTYRIYPIHHWGLVFVGALAGFLCFFDRLPERPSSPYLSQPLIPQKVRLAIAGFSFGIAFLGWQSGLNGFRYSSTSAFAGSGFLVYFVAILPIVVKFDLLAHVFFRSREQTEQGPLALVIRVLMCGAALLTVSGTSGALFALIYLIYTVSPQLLIQLLSIRTYREFGIYRCLLLVTALITIPMLGYIGGETVKSGGNFALVLDRLADPGFINWAVLWAMERTSASYYSLLMAINDFLISFDISNLLIPIKTIYYRVDVLLGRPWEVVKPEFSSISRLNYDLLSYLGREREGTSPGLIGGFLLCFPFPLSLLALLGYSVFLVRLFNSMVSCMYFVPNLGALLITLWFSLVLFESPIDLLLLFDESTISFFGVILLILRARSLHEGFRSPYLRAPRLTERGAHA